MAKIFENAADVKRDQLANQKKDLEKLKSVANLSATGLGYISLTSALNIPTYKGNMKIVDAVLTGVGSTLTAIAIATSCKAGKNIKKIEQQQKILGPQEIKYPVPTDKTASPAALSALKERVEANFSDRVTKPTEECCGQSK